MTSRERGKSTLPSRNGRVREKRRPANMRLLAENQDDSSYCGAIQWKPTRNRENAKVNCKQREVGKTAVEKKSVSGPADPLPGLAEKGR